MTLNAGLDMSPTESRGKVLTVPATPAAARKNWSGLKKYGLAGALVALLVITGGIAAGLWGIGTKGHAQYVTVLAARGAITRTVSATGTVNPVLTIIVGSYVSGVIQSLSCDYNTEVKAGQVCAKIDPRPYQATLDQYSGQLARDQAVLEKDRKDLARYQQLAAESSIARQQTEDQNYVVSQDEGTVELDQGLVEGAQLNLGYTDIVSPVDGTVVSRNVTQGQTVASSFQTPTLFLIATDLKSMQVDTNTSESDIGEVKEGANATFTVDAFPKRIFKGTISQVRQSPQTVQNVVTYDAVVSVDNSDLALKPGMTASTQIIVDQRNDVLRVPDQALRYTPSGLARAEMQSASVPPIGSSRLWVLRDGKPVAMNIVTGLDDGNFIEVVQGDLNPGDKVITSENQAEASSRLGTPQPRL
jgi:HlyD family secretion protein